MRRPWVVLLIVLAASARESRTALAQCDPVWQVDAGMPVAARVASDSRFGLGLSFIAAGSSLVAVWNESGQVPIPHAAGQVFWTKTFGSTIQNFPNPVPIKGGGEAVFVSASDGFVYRIDAASGATQWSRDLRRGSCSTDQVVATPAVQLWDFSDASFQTKFAGDVVFVITRHLCGDLTGNEVHALGAADGSVHWVFKPLVDLAISMDGGSAAGTIEYATNRVYFGTLPGGGVQPTLWALSTLDGSLVWSRNVGSIQNRPVLAGGRLYVGTAANRLRAHVAATGAPIWIFPFNTFTSGSLTKDIWVETASAYDHLILATDGDGTVWALHDDTTAVAPALFWKYGDVPMPSWWVTTAPVLDAGTGRVYVGRSDGRLSQLSATAGFEDAARMMCLNAPVTDLTLDVTSPQATGYERLIAPQASKVARICIPWQSATVENIGCVSVGVGPRDPRATSLGPPRPNPLRSSARFDVHLASAGSVRIAIYDLQGGRVRTLVRGWREAGQHPVVWDGRRENGSPAANGVYFCRLEAGPGVRLASEAVIVLR